MSACQTPPMILAIGSRNTFLHVYKDDRELLADKNIGAGEEEHRFPLEFFDSEGHRLAGEYDGQWSLLRLVPTADPPDLDVLKGRVQQVFDHMRSYAKEHPEKVALLGLTVDELIDTLPRLDEHLDFRMSLLACMDSEDGVPSREAVHSHDEQDDWTSSPSHNWAHIAGR